MRVTESEYAALRAANNPKNYTVKGDEIKTQPAVRKCKKAVLPKPPTEHEEQVALMEWVRAMEPELPELQMLFAIPNGAKLPYRKVTKKGVAISHERAKMLKEGMRPGIPDLMLPVARRDYYGCFIEMKRAKKSLSVISPEQQAWIDALTQKGYFAVICYGAEEAKATILNYLGVGEAQ